jgi:hypothetical protein
MNEVAMKFLGTTTVIAPIVLIILTIWMAFASPARAGDHVSFECAGFRAVPPEAVDRNPVVKSSVAVYWPRNQDDPISFEVTHTTLSGESYLRDQQYRDIRLWSNQNGDFWAGVSVKEPRRTMIGQLAFDDSRGISARRYIEKSYVNGRLERTTTSTCIWN